VIGKHINNYEIASLLGEGGMGTVYLALHPIMGRKAAIKVLKPELARDESLVMRFFNEARAANAIRHPNIIDIIDVGLLPEDNVPYMLMEFLEGESLSSRLDHTRVLPVDVAVEIAFQTASALAAAHSKGIVHRDLKPDNLFLIPDEMVKGGERVKVLDFGIAKLRDDLRGSSMKTRTGAIMGTATYMSPEQCQGLIERIDQRTDIYALGVILYEMLCGAPPFASEGFGDILIMHVMREPDPPRRRNPAVTSELAATMLRALAKDPAHRFQSMTEFQSALRPHTGLHLTPSPVATAILDGPETHSARHVSHDHTPAAAAGESAEAEEFSSDPASVLLEPRIGGKQSTTLRTSNGELSDTDMIPPGGRRTAIAVAAIVGLAALGFAVTFLVTRPSDTRPAAEPVPAVRPPEPEPEPEMPPPPPAPEHARVEEQPAASLPPVPEEAEKTTHPKKAGGRTKKPSEATAPPPARPTAAPANPKNDIERW